MANFTPKYNLKKPLGSENYNVADQNGNMDIIDTALDGIDNGLAIVSTGNTHGAITSGQYVYVRRHNTLAEGLYKANSNIAANATLTSSNLSSVSGGLGADVASLNTNLPFKVYGHTPSSVGVATWTTTGITFTNRTLIAVLIETSGSYFLIAQGTSGISVSMDSDNRPVVYLPAEASSWFDKNCIAVYA